MTPDDRPCPECGHSDRMHVRGASPKYAGCMTRLALLAAAILMAAA